MSTTHTSPNGTASKKAVEAEAPMADVVERLGPKLEEAQEHLFAFNERVKGFIKDNPGTMLVGAAALGFLIGRWASRK